MSLAVVIKGPEGVVLAVDSRVTVDARTKDATYSINYDNASKFMHFKFPHDYVGVVTYGGALIGLRTPHSFLPELEPSLPETRQKIIDYAKIVSDFYLKQWNRTKGPQKPKVPIFFIVAGYDEDRPYGSVYLFRIPETPEPEPRNPDEFGVTWGGQPQIVSRIITGFDPLVMHLLSKELGWDDKKRSQIETTLKSHLQLKIPYDILPLQDCVDLAILMIRTTIAAQSLAVEVRGVGGPIELATITRTAPLHFVQKKAIHGEERMN